MRVWDYFLTHGFRFTGQNMTYGAYLDYKNELFFRIRPRTKYDAKWRESVMRFVENQYLLTGNLGSHRVWRLLLKNTYQLFDEGRDERLIKLVTDYAGWGDLNHRVL